MRGPEPDHIGRVVLAVGIDGDNMCFAQSPGFFCGGKDCRPLSFIDFMADCPHRKVCDGLDTPIGTAVIDNKHVIVDGKGAGYHLPQGCCMIIHRDNDKRFYRFFFAVGVHLSVVRSGGIFRTLREGFR